MDAQLKEWADAIYVGFALILVIAMVTYLPYEAGKSAGIAQCSLLAREPLQ